MAQRSELQLQLVGHRLTTAEIIYRLPDHPRLLQIFVWQTYDIAPRFPRLCRFLQFWEQNIEGVLHTVRIAQFQLIRPAEFSFTKGELRLH